jgi:bifunctional DNase/RNase
VRRSGRAAEFGSRKPHGHQDSQHEQACCRSTGPRSVGGGAVFLGNEEKVIVIYVDQSVGVAIAMFMQGTQRERPLTHDPLANILRALGAKIDRVIVNDLKQGTYFPRLVLTAENELNQKKIVGIDARPRRTHALVFRAEVS